MAKFNKHIVSEGFYVVSNGNGQRKLEFIDEQRMKHWSDQAALMNQAGIRIPAPDKHHPQALPEGNKGNKWSSSDPGSKSNFGFWDSFEVKDHLKNGKNLKALYGTVDVPVDQDAQRVGTSVKETSICALPEFIDGEGRVWKDVLTHVALVTNPIEPGQDNFQRQDVPGNALALSMSHHLENLSNEMRMAIDDADATASASLSQLLKMVAGIVISDTLSPENLEQELITVLKQKYHTEKSMNKDGSTSQSPPDSHLQQVPIAMSHNQDTLLTDLQSQNKSLTDQIKELKEDQDQTKQQLSQMTAMSQVQQQHAGLMAHTEKTQKEALKKRIEVLKRKGVITDQSFLDGLATQVDGIQMSFDSENNLIKTAVEAQIEALERVPVSTPANHRPMLAMATENADGTLVIQSPNRPQGNGPDGDGWDNDEAIDSYLSKMGV